MISRTRHKIYAPNDTNQAENENEPEHLFVVKSKGQDGEQLGIQTMKDDSMGAVAWDDDRNLTTFEYVPAFLAKNLEISPLTMPLAPHAIHFPN